ncbi:hypothetical protein [Burkholderia lata]|uniref:hypothetical protein n=1 Tax=Burkholderia lata (strain ATCC 17760 / DSM 23089 / LMG 22485 / NCIMB 9086 / R18194 / 383) TaxID=482957 RepID=UPI00399C16AD
MSSPEYLFDAMKTPEPEQPVFVLTTPAPADVSAVLADQSRFGPAVRCFLSPFDALLGMVFLQRQDSDAVEAVLQSGRLPVGIFFSNRFRQRPLTVHVAWLAHENRLIAHQDGHLIRAARDQAAQWRMSPRRHPVMAIEAETWAILDRLYESAGLFAWRDTLQIARRWLASPTVEESSLRRAVAALDAVAPMVVPAGEAKQLALYDPEAGCWHFVPRDVIA